MVVKPRVLKGFGNQGWRNGSVVKSIGSLPEGPDSIPNIRMVTQNCDSRFRASDILIQTYMQAEHQWPSNKTTF